MTEVIKADDPGSHERTASVLGAGGVVIYPTETLYGIGALATDEAAVKRVFGAKGRPAGNPVPVLVRDLEMLSAIAELNEAALTLAARFWPGPLTMVLKEKGALPAAVTAESGKVAVRISGHPFVRSLFKYLSQPITSTSANPSGAGNIFDPQYIYKTFSGAVELVIDSGNIPPSKGSTIVDLTVTPHVIVREGDIAVGDIQELL